MGNNLVAFETPESIPGLIFVYISKVLDIEGPGPFLKFSQA